MKETYRKKYAEAAKKLVAEMTLEERAAMLLGDSVPVERLDVPAYHWWNEGLHGVARAGIATVFPQAIGLAATFDRDLLQKVGEITAYEGRIKYNCAQKEGDHTIYKGLTFWSPNINIYRDARWGRGQETYGEDPFLTAECAKSYISGVEICPDERYQLAAACLKHLAAHSGPEGIRHGFNSEVSEFDLYDTYLRAFHDVITTTGVDGVMGAYNTINGVHCCGNKHLMTDVLRKKWGFDGYYVSDCGALADMHMFCLVTHTATESAALALQSGCDLNCGDVYRHVMEAYHEGMVTEAQITQAAERVVAIRMRLGILQEDDCPYDKWDDITQVDSARHRRYAYDAAVKGSVLLKNNGILPLEKKRLKTVGVIGPNAASIRALEGNYNGSSSRYITLLQGIQDSCGEDVRVLYAKGCPLFEPVIESCALPKDGFAEALAVANASDVVILAMGFDASIEGEQGDANNAYGAGDKLDLQFPGLQPELMQAIKATGKPVVLVVFSGGPLDLSWADQNLDAILYAWYPGAEGGHALADILFGDANPSGKTPITFYRSVDDLPPFENYSMKGRTYRYQECTPLYEFGTGLSYTKFSAQLVGSSGQLQSDDLVVNILVKNEGDRDSEVSIPLFAVYGQEPYPTPNKKLCGFTRCFLAAGESCTAAIPVLSSALMLTDEQGEWHLPQSPLTFIPVV